MLTVNKQKYSNTERKQRRDAIISSFFKEVDSGDIEDYVMEKTFSELLRTYRSKASFIQKAIRVNGRDHLDFEIMIPYKIFCAVVSQFNFNRKADIKFTCRENNFSVEILLTSKADVELLLGPEALLTKQHSEDCFSEIAISDLYPAKVKFNRKSEFLTIGLDLKKSGKKSILFCVKEAKENEILVAKLEERQYTLNKIEERRFCEEVSHVRCGKMEKRLGKPGSRLLMS